MSELEALRPCPFCGGEVTEQGMDFEEKAIQYGCSPSNRCAVHPVITNWSGNYDTLAEQWNRRKDYRWISVKDRLPELVVQFNCPNKDNPQERDIYYSSVHVLANIYNHDEDHTFVDKAHYCPHEGGWQHMWEKRFCTGEVWNEVTHWMPLPYPLVLDPPPESHS